MFVILSHCNTHTKKEILKNLTDELNKKFPDREILIYSNYQNLEPHYSKASNYCIIDRENPELDIYGYVWRYVPELNKTIIRKGIDRGYAVLNMIKKSSLFLKSIGKKQVTFINYDYSVDDVTEDKLNIPLDMFEDKVAIFNSWARPDSVNLILFHLDLEKIDYNFFDIVNENKYRSYNAIPAEDIFYRMFDEKFPEKFSFIDKKLIPVVDSWNNSLIEGHFLTRYFDSIALTTEENSDQSKKYISLYITLERINNILVNIDGKESLIDNKVEGENSNRAFFSELPESKIEIVELLEINGKKIPTHTMENLDDNFWINNYHK
jgi:hypothetical protein